MATTAATLTACRCARVRLAGPPVMPAAELLLSGNLGSTLCDVSLPRELGRELLCSSGKPLLLPLKARALEAQGTLADAAEGFAQSQRQSHRERLCRVRAHVAQASGGSRLDLRRARCLGPKWSLETWKPLRPAGCPD